MSLIPRQTDLALVGSMKEFLAQYHFFIQPHNFMYQILHVCIILHVHSVNVLTTNPHNQLSCTE